MCNKCVYVYQDVQNRGVHARMRHHFYSNKKLALQLVKIMNADTSIWPHQIESRLQRQASLYHNTTYHLGLLLNQQEEKIKNNAPLQEDEETARINIGYSISQLMISAAIKRVSKAKQVKQMKERETRKHPFVTTHSS